MTAVALYAKTIDFDLTQFVRKQIDLRTSYASSKPDYLRAFKLLLDGKVDGKALLSIYNLQDAEKAFLDSESLRVMKAVLACQG